MKTHKIRAIGRTADGTEVALMPETLASQVKCIVDGGGNPNTIIPLDELINQYAEEINDNTTAISGKAAASHTHTEYAPNAAYAQANAAYNLASNANSTASTANNTANNAMPKSGGTFTGNVRFQTGGSNYGSKINFGDSDYVYLHEDSDDSLTIKANNIKLMGNVVDASGNPLGGGGSSTPLSSSVTSTSTTTAATSSAVKQAYDLASTANSTASSAYSKANTAHTQANAANSLASTANSTASSLNTKLTGTSLNIGSGASSGSYAVAIGYGASSASNYGISIGRLASIGSTCSIAVGYNASVTGQYGISIGPNAITHNMGIAIGTNADSSSSGIAIGHNSVTATITGMAIGTNARATANGAQAIGYNTIASASGAIALGEGIASGIASIVIKGQEASGSFATALGAYANAAGDFSTALGYSSKTAASEANTIQLGSSSSLSVLRCKVSLTVTSDERDKADIKEITNGLDFINKIEPVTYRSNPRLNYLKASSEKLSEKEKELEEKLQDADLDIPTLKELLIEDSNGIVDEKAGQSRLKAKKMTKSMFSAYADVLNIPDILPLSLEQQESKENIELFGKYGLSDYDREAHARGDKKGQRQRVGVKAQQVIQALKEVYGTADYANIVNDNLHDVVEIPDGIENQYTIAYTEFIPFLINAIQELSAKIGVLEARLSS